MDKKEQTIKRAFSNNFMMLRYIAKYVPGLFVWTLFSAILSGTVGVLDTVYLAKYVLDGLAAQRTFGQMLPFLLFVMALNLALALANGIYNGSYFLRKKEYLYGRMHRELFEKAVSMDLACYDDPGFYNDFVWAMSEADEKALGVLTMVSQLFTCLTVVGGTAAIIVSLNAAGIFVVAFGVGMEWFVQKKINRLDYDLALIQRPLQRKRDYTSRVLYQPEYAKEIRLTPVKEILTDQFCETNKDIVSAIRRYGRKIVFYDTVLSKGTLYNGLLYGLYMGYLLYGTLVQHLYTYGSFYALFAGTDRLMNNWNELVSCLAQLRKNSRFIEKFRRFMEYEPQIKKSPDGAALPETPQPISLKNVSFIYEGAEKPALENIDLTIRPGEKIALVGYNGAGKTTLIKLLLRLYDVSSGEISLGGRNIREYDLNGYRNYFGAVFQDYRLLAATLGENVKMDLLNSEDGAGIKDALKRSGFQEKLDSLPLGTGTMVSREFDKNGVLLSGGESQKVAISRTFFRNSHVVVLDEPSSALDPVSEYNVNQSMLAAAKDKTVIFISHRLSTTRIADRIIMLEKGRIIEQGSHEELMRLNGKYAEMFQLQAENYKSPFASKLSFPMPQT